MQDADVDADINSDDSKYSPELIDEYDRIHQDNRFLLSTDFDTLSLAIGLMEGLIEKDPTFLPAYYNKYDYLCRLGEKDEAMMTLKVIAKYEKENYSLLFHMSLIYEQIGIPDSASYYLNSAIDNYETKCNQKKCTEDELADLIFFKLYRGDFDEKEALAKLRDLIGVDDYLFYSSLWENFDHKEVLNLHCQKVVK